jgi:hypothetical protein
MPNYPKMYNQALKICIDYGKGKTTMPNTLSYAYETPELAKNGIDIFIGCVKI